MDIQVKLLTVFVSTLLGAGVGFLAKSYFTRLSFQQRTIESIVERYLDVRDKLCGLIAECATHPDVDDSAWMNKIQRDLSMAYYQYYDYIPHEVVQEIICLQACVKDPKNRLHNIRDDALEYLDDSEVQNFCESFASFRNNVHAMLVNLHHGADSKIRNHRIEYQARHTLRFINQYFTEDNLTSLVLFRPKK